jgi:PAS domain S-box-containing protein
MTARLDNGALAAVMDAVPDGVLLIDESGVVQYANGSAARLFGFERERLIGMGVEDLLPDRFRAAHVGQRHAFVRDGRSRAHDSGLELYALRADGSELPVEIGLAPVPTGGPKLMVATVHDRTEQQRREQERLALAEMQTAVINAAPDGILLVRHDGVIQQANAAAAELFAYPLASLVGMHVEQLVPLRARDLHEHKRAAYQHEPQPRPMGAGLDLYALRGDGAEIPVEISLAPMPSPDGAPVTVAIARDRTAQRRAQAEREALARAQAVEEVVSELEAIVWESDSADRASLTYLGGSEQALLGYPREQWLREGFWLSVVHAEDRLAALTFAEAAREQNQFELEYRLIAADGTVRAVRDIVTVSRGRDGTIERLRGVIVDVTDRRDLEQRLAQAQKMEAVGQLAGGIAHDFNNLLTVVSGYAHRMLRREIENNRIAEQHEPLRQIVAATDRAAELTRQLLSFARRGQGEPTLVDPAAVLTGLCPLLERILDEDISLTVTVDDPPPLWINRSDVEQVIMNLVVNARDAMPHGGTLTVTAVGRTLNDVEAGAHGVAAGRYLLMEVTDSGEGMPPSVRARIFEPFFTTKPQGKGTGMGLATVYGIVDQNRGFIECDSRVGHGTTFRIGMPAAADWTEAPAESSIAPGSTILIVEDEDALRNLIAEVLREEGYGVLVAANGRDALTLAERHRGGLDLLVTDVVMPHLSGPELAERLRGLRPGTQVLFMSGYNDSRLVSRGVEAAKANLLHKPFAPKELVARVAELLTPPA